MDGWMNRWMDGWLDKCNVMLPCVWVDGKVDCWLLDLMLACMFGCICVVGGRGAMAIQQPVICRSETTTGSYSPSNLNINDAITKRSCDMVTVSNVCWMETGAS